MAEESSIKKSADLLIALASTLGTLLQSASVENAGPDIQLLARFCVHTVRQVQAICILIGKEEAPYFAEQAGQLLRGLCETWGRASWLMKPNDENERIDRAWRIYKDGVVNLREKVQYDLDHSHPVTKGWQKAVADLDLLLAKREQFTPLKGMPDSRSIYEALGRSDFYSVFRHESDPAHVSAVTLGAMVAHMDARSQHLGGPNPSVRRAQVLLASRALLEATARVIIAGLGLDSGRWEEDEALVRGETDERLQPLVGA